MPFGSSKGCVSWMIRGAEKHHPLGFKQRPLEDSGMYIYIIYIIYYIPGTQITFVLIRKVLFWGVDLQKQRSFWFQVCI